MSITWSGGFALSLMLLAVPRLAAPVEAVPAPLRWPQVVAAVDQHPLVQEAAARERGATGVIWAAEELPNPVVGLSVGDGVARDGSASRREWAWSVELPLDFLASRAGRVRAARAGAEGARQDARGARAQALRELRRLFVAVAHDQAVLAAGAELEAQVAQLAALIRKRVDRGEGRPTEVARIELELERLRTGQERTRAGAEARRLRLATWLGAPVTSVEGDLGQALDLPPLEALQGRLLERSPAILGARARLDAATAERSAERWDRLPRLSVGGSRTEELDRRASTVAATVTVPLWSWNGGKIRQAEAALQAEQARLDAASRELTAALSDAWRGCAAGQAAAGRFQGGILPRAEASARTLGRAFELGEAGLLDVIDARRVLLETRREHLDLLLEMQTACGELAALAGLELP